MSEMDWFDMATTVGLELLGTCVVFFLLVLLVGLLLALPPMLIRFAIRQLRAKALHQKPKMVPQINVLG
jgi:hypothetical protein